MRSFVKIALLVVALVAFVFPANSGATIYRWQDSEGNLHFTDDLMRVPPSYRERVQVEDLPEESVSVIPVPPMPSDMQTEDQPDPVDAYAECRKELEAEKQRWSDQLREDRERLEELKRLIHRTVIARQKLEYQRELVEVRDRISQAEEVLRDVLPEKQRQCESIRYWQTTE